MEKDMQNDIRVAIFEDNQLFRDAMKAILMATPGYTCCGAFPDVRNVADSVKLVRPDVVLMDIEMPGISGLEATRVLRTLFPELKILIQTVFNDGERIFETMCAGASGYILKSDPPEQYLEAITRVFNGESPMNPEVARKVLGFFSQKNVILVTPANEDFQLTRREKELLQMMVAGDDYKVIAAKSFISYATVRTHVQHIYHKLHVASRHEAIMKATQHGLI
jgi:DNA-binding NarL/FixJ family response regulator